MLNISDYQEKKIVFIGAHPDWANDIKFRNSNVELYRDGELLQKISCHLVLCLFVIGNTTITTPMIKNAKEFGISIFLLNRSLALVADIMSEAKGNYKLRRIQYTMSKKRELMLSRTLIENKVSNQSRLLRYRHIAKCSSEKTINNIRMANSLSSLRGFEGSYASKYFSEIFEDLEWYRRAPRTKEDIPNLLLDIGYTFMFNYVDSLLNLFGFDTYKGFYHQLFFQRKSLSCDLMEPMRVIIDKQLVKSYNLKQIDEKDFQYLKGMYKIKKGKQSKYALIWLDSMVEHNVDIYNYILMFYRHLLYPNKYSMPIFKISYR